MVVHLTTLLCVYRSYARIYVSCRWKRGSWTGRRGNASLVGSTIQPQHTSPFLSGKGKQEKATVWESEYRIVLGLSKADLRAGMVCFFFDSGSMNLGPS